MKDKRTLLKIAGILELIYAIGNIIYYLFFKKLGDEAFANIFLSCVGIFFAITMLTESKKDIKFLKESKTKIIIASVYTFLDSIIPGILGFIFLNYINDKKKAKKKANLPKVKEEKITISTIIKSFSTFILFMLLMFILPIFKFYNKIPSIIVYVFIFLYVFIINFKYLKNDFKLFKSNFKVYLPFIIKRYFSMLGIMMLVSLPIVLINNGEVSDNQKQINDMFINNALFTFLLSSFYAPFVEESIFRLDLSKLLRNKIVFIIVSGVTFGVLHVINKMTNVTDILYILEYSALGICLAKAYSDSKNIFVSMSIHFIQNFLASILMLIMYLAR